MVENTIGLTHGLSVTGQEELRVAAWILRISYKDGTNFSILFTHLSS